MQTRRIYFVGLRQGLRVWKTRRFIEQHRRGEDEDFRRQRGLRRTRIPGRADVLFDRVINYHAMVSDKLEFRVADMVPELFDRWVEANRELRRRIDRSDFSSQLVRAVAAVGNNIGAVDFLLRDGAPVLLEVNPIWGAVPRRYSFGNADFERLVEQHEEFWSKELPNIAYNLDVVRFYREMYGYIAEYFDRGSHRSDLSGASSTPALEETTSA